MAGGHPASITYIANVAGPPKGVVHSPAEILATADLYGRRSLGLTSADVCIGALSPAWAYGLGALVVFPLRVGATTVLVNGPMMLPEAIAAARATVLFGVPTIYRMLLHHPELRSAKLGSLRCCVSSAEPLPPSVIEQWRASTGLEILDGFGTTELAHIVLSAAPGSGRPGLVGTPIPGYKAQIVDDDMRPVATGTPGLLAVRGPTGARYWRDSDAQRQAVRNGWTLTSDICVQHPDGWFEHLGRSDGLIVTAGQKVSKNEVVGILEEHPHVLHARVFSIPDPIRGAVLKAVVTAAEQADLSTLSERLRQYLHTRIASFKCPKEIQVRRVDINLPRLSS
jgi:2-aminobenzoate-CoA ligase